MPSMPSMLPTHPGSYMFLFRTGVIQRGRSLSCPESFRAGSAGLLHDQRGGGGFVAIEPELGVVEVGVGAATRRDTRTR